MSKHFHLCSPETSLAVADFRSDRSWRVAAIELGYPPSFAPILCGIAAGKAGQVTAEGEQELRRRLGLSYDLLHIVPVPSDHDADVHLRLNGSGQIHTYHVPEDADVVIVPAGARVVQPHPTNDKPRRKRVRLDITSLPLLPAEARTILLLFLERYRRDVPE